MGRSNNTAQEMSEELFLDQDLWLRRPAALRAGRTLLTPRHSEVLFCANTTAVKVFPAQTAPFTPADGRELPEWLLRAGMAAESMMPVSRSGLYMDFTCGSNGL